MRHHMAALIVCLCVASPAFSAAPFPSDLRQAMRQRLEAVWSKDVATWSRLTAEEFTVVVPEGHLQTKAQRIAALRLEAPETPHQIHQEDVRVYGNAAVRRFIDGTEWILEVWVREKGRWRVVASQVNFRKP